jgi:hypothetical protein
LFLELCNCTASANRRAEKYAARNGEIGCGGRRLFSQESLPSGVINKYYAEEGQEEIEVVL